MDKRNLIIGGLVGVIGLMGFEMLRMAKDLKYAVITLEENKEAFEDAKKIATNIILLDIIEKNGL